MQFAYLAARVSTAEAHRTIVGVIPPQPGTTEQYKAVQAIWTFLTVNDRWPTFSEIDRQLDRWDDITDAAAVLAAIPAGVLYGVTPGRPDALTSGQEVGLTVAGALATDRARDELELFRRAVRLAAHLERGFHPSPTGSAESDQPVLTAADLARQLSVTANDQLARLRALLRAEEWGSESYHDGDPWYFTIGRGVRRFRDVGTIEEYWQRREEAATSVTRSSVAQALQPNGATSPSEHAPPVTSEPTEGPSSNRSLNWEKLLPVLIGLVALAFAVPAVNASVVRAVAFLGLGAGVWAAILPWRGSRAFRWVGGAVAALCVGTLVWTVLPPSMGRLGHPAETGSTEDLAPRSGTCLPITTAICRYARLADGQEFNLNEWGQPHHPDIKLTAEATLSPVGGARLSPAFPGEGASDPRICWTVGNWGDSPQQLTRSSRICVWTTPGQFGLVSLAHQPDGARYTQFTVAMTTDGMEAEPPAIGRTVVVDNRVTDGMQMREDDELARLTGQPKRACSECVIDGTFLPSGAHINAVCQTEGDEVTNEQKESSGDDQNLGRWTSSRWYRIRWPDGRSGLLPETWLRREDRGGLSLPTCR